MLVVGPLHGDERVAATAAFNFIILLTTRSEKDPWLARLLRTRRIVVVPLPSASAYDKYARFEEIDGVQVDAAQFPFARRPRDDKVCLRSTAAKVIDALFSKYSFVMTLQLAAGGDQDSISWPWAAANSTLCPSSVDVAHGAGVQGSQNSSVCASIVTPPDYLALRSIAESMSAFAGPSYRSDESNLQFGAYNELFDSLDGSLLDYAYGASWVPLPDLVSSCGVTPISNTSHRSAAFLIRSHESAPEEGSLGSLSNLYKHEPKGNVVTRILRALLAGCDFALPYVFWLDGGDYNFEARSGIAHIRWSVAGAASVQETWLTCRLDDDPATEWTTPVQSGGSMWSQGFDDRVELTFHKLHELNAAEYDFRQTLLLYKRMTSEQRSRGCRLHLRAEARVDENWAVSGLGLPQSHLVQLRSNNSWVLQEHSSKRLQGSRIATTRVMTLEVPPVSGVSAFLDYVWNFLLLAVFVCVFPPAALLYYTRRAERLPSMPTRSGVLIAQRVRTTLRRLARRDVAAGSRIGREEHSASPYQDSIRPTGSALGNNADSWQSERRKD